jgi:putative ABC transport system permease protein
MFRTNLRFLVRIFLKDKFFSLLNVLGLALGIGMSILLLLILQNDLTYDHYYSNYKKIYRLGGHLSATGIDERIGRSARELAAILKGEVSGIENTVRANSWDHTFVKYQPPKGPEIAFYEEDIVRTDSNYFAVFNHPGQFISGDPATCLKDVNSVVLTQSAAKKYFGNDDPMDKMMTIGDALWKVTAVVKDPPPNIHLKYSLLISGLVTRGGLIKDGVVESEAFWNPDVYTYLVLKENADPNEFEAKFRPIFNKYFKSFGDKVGGQYASILEPLESIHFHSSLNADEPHGNIAYVYAFTGIGVFIILLACINYMNLATAKSVNRAGEIAMKKTLGSGKTRLIFSFLGESVFLAFISLFVAILLVFLILGSSSFNILIGRDLSPDFLHNPVLLVGSVASTLLIGIVSGLYPAFYLPRIPTLTALKGAFKNRKSSLILRKVLITTQFAISIFVVICTLFMQNQINYIRNKDLGFNKDNMLILPIQDSLVQANIDGIKSELLQNPRITAATTSYNVPGTGVGGPVMWAETDAGMKQQAFNMMNVGDDYFKTLGIKVIAGRDFTPGKNDSHGDVFIINEAAARLMGWKDPVGKKVKFFHAEKDGKVVGMVKDFNYTSLHDEVEPLLIVKPGDNGGSLYLKVSGDHLPETIETIRKKWTKLDPGHPFEYFFLDQKFDEQYKADETQFRLLSGLSSVCIFISLLGLLGLSAFNAAQRTKEIGVRKVMGATIPQIVYLLFKDVMILVLLASVIVVPVALYTMTQWISNFHYRIPIGAELFVVVTVLALVFTFVTVAFHSLRIARTNPVDSLKYE